MSRSEKFSMEIVDVTPDLARKWLEVNESNRRLDGATVARYARDMAAGHWQFAADPIRFSKAGALQDGQHRLSGVIRSGAIVPMVIVRGLEEKAQHVMDGNRKRGVSDALTISGETSTGLLAATLRLARIVDLGRLVGPESQRQASDLTISEVEEFLAEHPEFREIVAFVATNKHKVPMTPSVFATFIWMARRVDEKAADEFVKSYITAADLPVGSPILALRDLQYRLKNRRERLPVAHSLILMVRAWNAWRTGRTLTHMKITERNVKMPVML